MIQSNTQLPEEGWWRWVFPGYSGYDSYCPQCGADGWVLIEDGFVWIDVLGDLPYSKWQCWMCGYTKLNPTYEEVAEMRKRQKEGRLW